MGSLNRNTFLNMLDNRSLSSGRRSRASYDMSDINLGGEEERARNLAERALARHKRDQFKEGMIPQNQQQRAMGGNSLDVLKQLIAAGFPVASLASRAAVLDTFNADGSAQYAANREVENALMSQTATRELLQEQVKKAKKENLARTLSMQPRPTSAKLSRYREQSGNPYALTQGEIRRREFERNQRAKELQDESRIRAEMEERLLSSRLSQIRELINGGVPRKKSRTEEVLVNIAGNPETRTLTSQEDIDWESLIASLV